MKYIRKFETKSTAIQAQDLLSPNVTYIAEGGGKLLNFDAGELDKPLEIKEQGREIIIQEKQLGPEMVDLGLPSGKLWMKYNLGVDPGQLTNASDWYGKYYQFGDIVGYTGSEAEVHSFWPTCPCNGGYSEYNETYFLAHKSELVNNNILLPTCDAVTIIYPSIHIPSIEDITELNNNTTSVWVTNYQDIDGLNGRTYTANNQSLFIPAGGFYYQSEFIDCGAGGYIWLNSLKLNRLDWCYRLEAYENSSVECDVERIYAHPVRGVKS